MNLKMFAIVIGLLPLLISCNIYTPFNKTGTEEEILEAARKCLHDNDYNCAISAYQQLPTSQTKNEKLCVVSLSKAGFGLRALTNTLTQQNVSILGDIANSLIPWTTEKSDAADTAKTYCMNYATAASAEQQSSAALLKTLGLFVHCAMRIAKTDTYLGTSESDTACTATGAGNGNITTADLYGTADGTITTSQPGMCKADADMCLVDMTAVSAAALTSAGLGDIKAGVDLLPAGLRTPGTASASIRQAIAQTLR